MNDMSFRNIGHTACPHDCPSACALDAEFDDNSRLVRIRGASDNSYTDGVICAKVARYAERLYHPDRLLKPRRRIGEKGAGSWQEISWEDALDTIAEEFLRAEQRQGSEAVWPYYYAGTMGYVQRFCLNRLRHAKRYSGEFETICSNPASTGFFAGTGSVSGPDPREMAQSDCIVIWGTNAVSTQVNVMTHATRARKQRGTKIVVVDVYDNDTARQADIKLILRPGTDGALACAVMHVLFRDNLADRAFMERYTDDPAGLENHLADRDPQWASAITGLGVDEIESFARLVGTTKKTYFRLGYGFTRQRNGPVNMHAASCIASVTGAWQYEGGGAFHSNSAIFHIDMAEASGLALCDDDIRHLDQSQIGRVLTGDSVALQDGGPVDALLIQNTNPVNVAPEQRLVREGFARQDLFVAVHEHFMTETAEMADIVLPATMFLEHDDFYCALGQQHLLLGPKLAEPPEGAKSNLEVVNALAERLGVGRESGFGLSANEHIDAILKASGYAGLEALRENKWIDCQPDFETSHYAGGFAWPDGRFRFRPDWTGMKAPRRPPASMGILGEAERLPVFPDHVDLIEEANDAFPFRLATSPARSFLNSSFSETKSSQKKEGRPEVMIAAEDAREKGIENGDIVVVGNERGSVRLHASVKEGWRRGVLVSEGLWPNRSFLDGEGINVLTGADQIAPFGGAAFHDNRVWLRRDASG